jgi:hypothetical protein
MIPTLIYSFYGMNVPIPFADFPFTVLGVGGVSLVVSALGAIFLNKMPNAYDGKGKKVKKAVGARHAVPLR